MTSGLPDYHRYIIPSPVVADVKVGPTFVAEYDSTPEDLTDGAKGPLLVDIKGRLWCLVDHKRIKGTDLKDPTIDESIPMSIENPAIAYDAVNDRFKVDIEALTDNEVDISDDATRLLGIVYGSQGQKLLQRATTYDLIAQLRHAGAEIDPRNIRALTASDVVTIQEPLGIDDHGGSITVDGAVTVSATNLDIRDLAKTLDEIYVVLRTDAGAAYDGREVTIQSQANPFTDDINVDDDALHTLIGEVQASPTANTVLARLKSIEGYVDGLEGYVDGLEGLLAGGLPSALDTGALKIREQNPLSTITVTQATHANLKSAVDLAQHLGAAISKTNPVMVGGVYEATPPTLSDGDEYALTLTSDGKVRTYDPTVEAYVDEVEDLLKNGTYGLSALDTDLGTLLTRLSAARAGYLDELDFDLNARLGTPAGASLAADIADLITRTKGLNDVHDDLVTHVGLYTSTRAGYLDELAAANIPADVDTLLTRLTALRAGYLDELDFDLNARLGTPAGASLAADLLTIDNLVDDLETRLTAARATNLDELAAANIPADIDTLVARPAKYAWKKKPVAALNQDPPVQNTYYTILDTTEDVRVISICTRQINDEAAAKNVTIRITIDGVTVPASTISHTNNTFYYWYHWFISENMYATTNATLVNQRVAMRGQSVKIEVKVTSAPGTNQQLDGIAYYETLEET